MGTEEIKDDGIKLASEVLTEKIGTEEVKKADQILRKYKAGKENLEARIVDNEQWWKLRHWDTMKGRHQRDQDLQPTSGWLFNVLMSKHADAMDAYPEGNILPREEGDKEQAKMLTDILPVVLAQNDFEQTYSDVWWYKLKQGTGVYGVFWDKSKNNGLGDISIKKIDLLNLYWEPGITDFQKSKNVFHIELIDDETLEQIYPQLKGKLNGSKQTKKEYVFDDSLDTTGKSYVVDWYYHTEYNGKKALQFVKYVNGNVLYATENDTEPVMAEEVDPMTGMPVQIPIGAPMSETGLYDHALYPFIFDVLFPLEGMPTGFGYIDVCKDPQQYIDLMNQGILKNTLMACSPRYFSRIDGSINEDEFADWTKPFVHVDGNLDDSSVRPIDVNYLSDVYVAILNNKIEELKETAGNRDVNNGGTTAGVTAASGIAALQEQSGKTSRDATKASYRAYKNLLTMCIELTRQFYDVPRQFRIMGERGAEQFITFDNTGIKPMPQGDDFGQDLGYRLPLFDLEISAQKSNPYNKMAQNELALQFFGLGFFNPQMADQAITCLEFMDFDHKTDIIQKIEQNGTMYQQMMMMQQQMLQMAQIIDMDRGTSMAEQMGQFILGGGTQPAPARVTDKDAANIKDQDALGNVKKEEHGVVKKAREQSADSVQPR